MCSEAEMLLWLLLRPVTIIIIIINIIVIYLKYCLVKLWIDNDHFVQFSAP